MYKIVIGIPTYRRPEMLKKLLTSIFVSKIDKRLIREVDILVVDNDIERTAENLVKELSEGDNGIFRLNYCNYPVKGLSNVRNELHKRALEFHPDFIASIDDDEYPTPDWLNQLVKIISTNKADAAVGPVIPAFETKVSPYLAYWFRYHDLPDNQKTREFETANYIINAEFLSKHKLEFDNRFNATGAEDSYFRLTLLKQGANIFWARNAVSNESIPPKRSTLKWLIRRNFRCAITFIYILKIERNYAPLLKKIFISVYYLLTGLLALIALPFPFRWKYWGIIKLSESAGGFAGLAGIKYNEYAKAR